MINGTYVSADALERLEAFHLGYEKVCHHPKEIGVLESDQILVIDFDHVMFNDGELAVRKANESIHRGTLVGFHTYYLEDPRLKRLIHIPNFVVAKTQADLLQYIHHHARLIKPRSYKFAQISVPSLETDPMSTEILSDPLPAVPPANPSTLPVPATEPTPDFPPSEELGNQLQRLEEVQAEIDRRQAEELARLREIQNRD